MSTTAKPAADIGLPSINRRRLLRAGSAAIVAGAAGLTARELAASDLTPVEAFYRQWREASRITKSREAHDMDDATFDAEMVRFEEAAWGVIEAEPTSVRDMALKIIVADDAGDMSMNVWQVELASKAYELTGEDSDAVRPVAAGMVLGASALAAPSPSPQKTEIERLFDEWSRLMSVSPPALPPAEEEAWCEEHVYRHTDAIETRLDALRARTAADLARKILVDTRWGDFEFDPGLLREMCGLVGIGAGDRLPGRAVTLEGLL